MAFADLTDEQLVHTIIASERELLAARFAHSQQQLENTATLGSLRKTVARLRTETRTREIAAGLNKDALVNLHAKTFQAAEATVEEGTQEKGGFLSGIVDKLQGKE
ncbi:MAG: 50S ribosomal protein L29 [Proteobacteria bacterium]|nr:50S ribosomal protein L29 [Pseudomonadota bacterium]